MSESFRINCALICIQNLLCDSLKFNPKISITRKSNQYPRVHEKCCVPTQTVLHKISSQYQTAARLFYRWSKHRTSKIFTFFFPVLVYAVIAQSQSNQWSHQSTKTEFQFMSEACRILCFSTECGFSLMRHGNL